MTHPSPVHELRVALTVDDYEAAVRFYRDVLGLPVVHAWNEESGSGAILAAGRATLELLSTAQAELVDRVEVGERVAGPVRLALEVDDSAATAEALAAAGAERLGGPVVTPWSDQNVRLLAPDGMQLTLFTVLSAASGVSGSVDLPTLHGRTVVLRPLRLADIERAAEIQAEPGVTRWWGPPDDAGLRQQAEGRSAEKTFAIESDGDLVGLIQYLEENEPDFRHAGIDLFLAERAQGRGLGTDAVRTLARYLMHERGHHRLTIDPAADNAAAIRAYEKVGFRTVGIMREYWRSPDGTWRDGLLMDLLARDFEPA